MAIHHPKNDKFEENPLRKPYEMTFKLTTCFDDRMADPRNHGWS